MIYRYTISVYRWRFISVMHVITSLVAPLFILGLGFYLNSKSEALTSSQLLLTEWLPLALAAVALLLCLKFNRSRMFFSVLNVMIGYALLQWYVPSAEPVYADIIWATLSIVLPLNLVVFSLLKERGMLTVWGSTRFAYLVLPILIIYSLSHISPEAVQQLLSTRLYKQDLITGLSIYQGPTLLILVTGLVLNGRIFARTTPQNSSLFIALIACVLMLHYWDSPSAKAVYASTAIIILVVAVIQESWSMAYIDPLTGLPGRRALDEAMQKLGSKYTIAMIDIDHFKKFNDKYGHEAGDQVLSMVAAKIRCVGTGGKVFRYGGEEFTILYPGKKVKEVLQELETIRQSIADSQFHLRSKDRRKRNRKQNKQGVKVRLTISAGAANRDKRMNSPSLVIKSADRALYRAKKMGRNAVYK